MFISIVRCSVGWDSKIVEWRIKEGNTKSRQIDTYCHIPTVFLFPTECIYWRQHGGEVGSIATQHLQVSCFDPDLGLLSVQSFCLCYSHVCITPTTSSGFLTLFINIQVSELAMPNCFKLDVNCVLVLQPGRILHLHLHLMAHGII